MIPRGAGVVGPAFFRPVPGWLSAHCFEVGRFRAAKNKLAIPSKQLRRVNPPQTDASTKRTDLRGFFISRKEAPKHIANVCLGTFVRRESKQTRLREFAYRTVREGRNDAPESLTLTVKTEAQLENQEPFEFRTCPADFCRPSPSVSSPNQAATGVRTLSFRTK